MLRYHVNRFQTGLTSGSRGSETNDRKKKISCTCLKFQLLYVKNWSNKVNFTMKKNS